MLAPGATEDSWSRYEKWNSALADVVYGAESSGQSVFLDLDDDVLERVAVAAGEPGAPRGGLAAAVRPTLNRPGHSAGVFGGHLARLRRWDSDGDSPPPTIALLALLSLAAEDMHEGEGFEANDYYNRLMPLLGIADDREKKRTISDYRRCSKALWGSLNDWLEHHEGEFGLPTAFAIGFAHVGLPISQAVLRATDREKLNEFFEETGFAPRTHLALRDMEAILGEWVTDTPSPATSAMQSLWRSSGSRARIVEGACALLETWDGPARSSGVEGRIRGDRPSAIQVMALRRTFPNAFLELNFTGPNSNIAETSLDLIDANGDVQQTLAVEQLTDRRWRLAEPERIDPLSALDGRLRLRDHEGLLMERRPRRVVALSHDALLQVYLEVDRLPLGESAMVFCKDELAVSMQTALGIIARPGFSTLSSELPGLPPGWNLFVDVQVLAPLPKVQPDGTKWEFENDLNVLQPFATTQLVVDAGLRLPGHLGRWSSLASPELRVAASDLASLKVVVSQTRSYATVVDPIELTTSGSACVVRLSDLSLPDGDYEVGASDATKGTAIDQIRVRLRSADVSTPVRGPSLRRPTPLDGVSVMRASAIDDEETPSIGGAAILRSEIGVSDPAERAVRTTPAWWDARRNAGDYAAGFDRIVLPTVALEDCFRSGQHIIVLPTYYGKAKGKSVEGRCKQCGIVKRYPTHHRTRSIRATERPAYEPPKFDSKLIPSIEDRSITPDVAFDALSHVHRGTARAFEQIALQIEPSRLFVDRFLRGLESLGHIEIARDPQTLTPTSWEVAPSALVQTRLAVFALAGFRSRKLFAALEAAADVLGAKVEMDAHDNAPTRIRLTGCDVTCAESIASHITEVTGIEIQVVLDAASSIATLLPPLSVVRDSLPSTAIVAFRSANRWNEQLARWEEVRHASAPGAYQLRGAVGLYCLRDLDDVRNGTMKRGDARVVKHIASAEAGFPLVGYDDETHTLYAPLGAELPGIYSRVAVLSSGRLASDDPDQHLVAYPSVPARVAARLLKLLSS